MTCSFQSYDVEFNKLRREKKKQIWTAEGNAGILNYTNVVIV